MGASTVVFFRALFLLFFTFIFCSSGADVVTVDVHLASDLLKYGYVYLDVRTVEEYKQGHVNDSKILNVPYMFNTPEGRVKNPDFLKEVKSLCNEDDKIVVGCQSGVRSVYATEDLLNAGFKHVRNMGGGYLAWVHNKYPVKVEEEIPEPKPKEAEL